MRYTLAELNKMVEKANEKGQSLYLDGLTSIPEGFNPTVGGGLYLNGLTSIPEGFNPTVGGSLYLDGLTSRYTQLKNGDYVPGEYLYADGILTHVKREKKIGEYTTYYVGKIPGRDVIFDGKNYAHCSSVKEGINELAFKSAKDRSAEQYRGTGLDEPIERDKAVAMYRIITGACKQGTQRFIDSMGELKDTYTAREIIGMTVNQYGGDAFRRFFEEE